MVEWYHSFKKVDSIQVFTQFMNQVLMHPPAGYVIIWGDRSDVLLMVVGKFDTKEPSEWIEVWSAKGWCWTVNIIYKCAVVNEHCIMYVPNCAKCLCTTMLLNVFNEHKWVILRSLR